jgi:hypothetical protein
VTTKRRAKLATSAGAAICLSAAALLGAGCDISPPAATVNASEISQNQLETTLSDVLHSAYARCALQIQGQLPSTSNGTGSNTVSAQLASYELSNAILEELVAQDLGSRHMHLTSADLAAAKADYVSQLELSATAGPSPCGISGADLYGRLPSRYAAGQVEVLAGEERLAAAVEHVDLSTPSLERYYLSHPGQFSQVCLSDIAVATQAQAQSVLGSITSGATTFSQAARQLSLDTSTAANGGALPCVLSSEIQNTSLLSAISTLAPGQVSQPVADQTSTGQTVYLLFQVDGRPLVPFASAEPRVRETLLSQNSSPLTKEFGRITADAHVSVDPRYGTWSKLRGVITPPNGPPSRFVLKPSADVVGSGSSSVLGG